MTSAAPTRVLVVAHRTAATPRLLDEGARVPAAPAADAPGLVPRPYWDPETEEAATTLVLALPLLDEAASGTSREPSGTAIRSPRQLRRAAAAE